MEPNGEFLLQLLQRGGDGRSSSSSRRVANGEGVAPSSEDLEKASGWQHHRDPAVAALGPSQPLFMAPPAHYGGGGVWTPPPQQQQQQQQQFWGARPPVRFPSYPSEPHQQPTGWRSEGWLPSPHHRANDGAARPWAPPMQPLKAPPQPQQFLGDGAELMQLLMGGGSQSLKPVNTPAELNSLLPKAQVHGPIGPPKRSEGSEPEHLLGRSWTLSNGSSDKPNSEEQMRSVSLNAVFDGSKANHSFKSTPTKPPPGFFGDGLPIDPAFVSSTVKALNHFTGVPKGPLAWEHPPSSELKQEIFGRAPADAGNHQNSSRFVRSREDGHAKAREDATTTSADFMGTESSTGKRGGGRRGGRAEAGGRSAGRSGQWVAVNEKQRERDGEREPDADVNASPHAAKAATTTSAESSPNSSGGKSKEDMKRRRGQIQEWRMKQASPPHFKPTAERASPRERAGSLTQQDGNSEGILPLASQVDRPGLPSNTVRPSMPGSATDESKQQLQYQLDEGVRSGGRERAGRYLMENGRLTWEDGMGGDEEEELMRELSISNHAKDSQQLSTTPPRTQTVAFLVREDTELEEKPGNLRDSREVRRQQQRINVPTHLIKGDSQRLDLETFNPQLLAIYKSLIPSQEEVLRQRKFLTHLDRLVTRDWGGAKLFLFGSCANDFGVRNSDIDVCLSVDDEHSKAELVTKMAAILRSDDMQNVQALTHARVPIVKFTDPDTGINCDICVNNMLAVVNSKLLHDYSQVDPRLRQLAFLVKHWAKQRQVNETYRGTLSSYPYVLMCIHFLQQRRPAILPCLQSMQPTYEVTVGTIKCAYFDKVNTLKNFGARNKETVAELLTYFFEYWASCHDYNRWVISVRTGGYLSKDEKDWTRRIGNERHLICIEDPFEITHDLGRVVDRHSIRVLRDEFKRAARALRLDPNPATTLFEPFIRPDKV